MTKILWLYWFRFITSAVTRPVRVAAHVLHIVWLGAPTLYRQWAEKYVAWDTISRKYIAGRSIETQAHEWLMSEPERFDPEKYDFYVKSGHEVVEQRKLDAWKKRLP